MGFWRSMRRLFVGEPAGRGETAPDLAVRARRAYAFSLEAPSEITGLPALGGVAPRISRREALQVPAVLRARNLIAGSLSTLPIRVHAPDRRIVRDVAYLVPKPDPDIPSSVVMAQTVEDLLFEGVAWWRVTRFGWHGFPVEAQHVPVDSVSVDQGSGLSTEWISEDQRFPAGGVVRINGVRVPDNEVIRFDSPNPPLLVHAARAIRTALLLDQAAARYSKDPLPLGYFTPADGEADPATDTEIEEILDSWEDARARRSWGYVNRALKAQPLQWNPEQLQLADQRQHAVLEIARAAGVDPEDLGVSTTSRTYQNGEQRRQDLLDFTLGAYVSAVQDRLSMRDVLPRNYEARIDFAGFLRSDTRTRMETYRVGLEVGAYTLDEVRELEDRPPLPQAQRPRVRPLPAGVPTQEREREVRAMSGKGPQFNADDTTKVAFDSPEVAASFRVNREKRTISGLAVPWGKVARSGFSRWRFTPNSLRWSDARRVKLNLHHDPERAIGYALGLRNTDGGLDVTFKVAEVPEGDRALALAEGGVLDGLSVEVDFEDGDEWDSDPADGSVRLVHRAKLRGVALTAMPAFDDARVTGVAASRDKEPVMDKEPTAQEAAPANGSAANGASAVTAPDLTQFTAGVSEALQSAVQQAFERLPMPQHSAGDRDSVPAGRVQVIREEPVYTFTGSGPSIVRDSWHARVDNNPDARDRLRKFLSQQQDMASLFQRRPDLAFAPETTATSSAIIPPGYRPDLYVTQLLQGRPFVDAVSRGSLTDATPFVIPRFVSATGAAANHVEGTNPADGDLTLNTVTVTPGAVSGKFQLTREIIDSANPAIDAIAFQAMREAYSQNTESKVYAELNGANGQGGTITAGFVPSGAQAYAIVVAGTPSAWGDELIQQVRAALAAYPFRRFGAPNRMHLSSDATSGFAAAVGTDGRPLLPSVGATNTAGVGNAVTQGWFVDGLAALPSWSMTGNAAGDADVLIYNSMDVWAWESPLLMFRFEEKSGPALIELALFGYFATRLLRPIGLVGIRHNTV